MTTIIELSARDMAGAAAQWRDYLATTLGFDKEVIAEVHIKGGGGCVYWIGLDSFQTATPWDKQAGQQRYCSVPFKLDSEWDSVCVAVWEKLKAAMPRDEREMRHAMERTGGMLEAGDYQSAVGKMIAERVRSLRDEVSAHLITFSKERAPNPERLTVRT